MHHFPKQMDVVLKLCLEGQVEIEHETLDLVAGWLATGTMDSVGLPIISCFARFCFPLSRSPSHLAHVAQSQCSLFQVLDYSITTLAVFQIFGSLFMLWDFLIHYSLPFRLPHLTHTSSSFRAQLKGSLLKGNSKHSVSLHYILKVQCTPTAYQL